MVLSSASAALLSATLNSINLRWEDYVRKPSEERVELVGDARIADFPSTDRRRRSALLGIDEAYANLTITGEFAGDFLCLDESSYRQNEPGSQDLHGRTQLIGLLYRHPRNNGLDRAGLVRRILDIAFLFDLTAETDLGQELTSEGAETFSLQDGYDLSNFFANCQTPVPVDLS